MFDPDKPRYLRALSLFHIVLPLTLLWLVARLGYDARALVAQTMLAWIVQYLSPMPSFAHTTRTSTGSMAPVQGRAASLLESIFCSLCCPSRRSFIYRRISL